MTNYEKFVTNYHRYQYAYQRPSGVLIMARQYGDVSNLIHGARMRLLNPLSSCCRLV
jgi:hypothetical protein